MTFQLGHRMYQPICAVREANSVSKLVPFRVGGVAVGVHGDDNASPVLMRGQVKLKTHCSLLPYPDDCPRFVDM